MQAMCVDVVAPRDVKPFKTRAANRDDVRRIVRHNLMIREVDEYKPVFRVEKAEDSSSSDSAAPE